MKTCMIDVTPSKHKLPIVVLAGFLGSGKTTLLNHLLREQNGVRIAAIVNDFGSVNVDSMLVAKQTDESIELSNGCICCEIGEGGLDGTLEELAHQGSTVQAIVIEASGLAEPADIAGQLLSSTNQYVYFDSLVYVIDGSEFETTKKQHPSLTEHVAAADCLVLNKTDLLEQADLESVETDIRTFNASAPLLRSRHGQVDTRLLLDVDTPPARQSTQLTLNTEGNGQDHHTHLHEQYQHMVFSAEKPLDPASFFALLDDPPSGIFRMKGPVSFGGKGFMEQFMLQYVAGRWDLKIIDIGRNERPTTEIVIIGAGYEESAVEQAFANTIDSDPDTINKDTLLDIMEYDRE